MDSPRSPDREKQIFEQALELPRAEARLGYLQDACGGDAILLARLETLLRAHEAGFPFLPENPGTAEATLRQPEGPERPGTTIGRYKLLEKIGEGGFGSVYLAEQEVPVRRRVALKVIKLGMDTRDVVARFEAERQALALMDHPNIAKVFDAGATEAGRPYFVMELVKGLPITTYCDQRKLSTPARMELFILVCQAVQHAHQKGIIHRDLKPSNILVTEQDDRPVAKVIDFGVARATQARLTEKTMFTQFHQMIGTPAYMSPEQTGLANLDIDTRSDIYSLGVLLYELLTGGTPFDSKKLLEAGYEGIMRIIREVEPPKPSTRLGSLSGQELAELGGRRQEEPRRLGRLVEGDLDWIVMKALEKDRTRRYETASSLAQDLQRHLGNEPVSARPPSKVYLLQKLFRRHRLLSAAAVAFVALWVVGTTVSTYLAVRAVRAEHQAEVSNLGEEHLGDLLYRLSAQASPRIARHYGFEPDPQITVRQAWDRLVAQLDPVDGSPPWRARAIENRGVIPETAGMVYFGFGDYAKAIDLLRKAVVMQQSEFGATHERPMATMGMLARAYELAGRPAEALPWKEQIYQLNRAHPDYGTPFLQADLGRTYVAAGQTAKGLALLEAAVETCRSVHGKDDVRTRGVMTDWAQALEKAGRPVDAIRLYEEILALEKPHYGPDSSQTPPTADLLARAYRENGRVNDAIKLGEETLQQRQPTGPSPLVPDILLARQAATEAELARSYHEAGRVSDAVRIGHDVLQRYEKLAQIDPGLAPRQLARDRADEWRHILEQWEQAGAAPKAPATPDAL